MRLQIMLDKGRRTIGCIGLHLLVASSLSRIRPVVGVAHKNPLINSGSSAQELPICCFLMALVAAC